MNMYKKNGERRTVKRKKHKESIFEMIINLLAGDFSL